MTYYCIKFKTVGNQEFTHPSFALSIRKDLFISNRSLDFADATLFYMEDAFLRRW